MIVRCSFRLRSVSLIPLQRYRLSLSQHRKPHSFAALRPCGSDFVHQITMCFRGCADRFENITLVVFQLFQPGSNIAFMLYLSLNAKISHQKGTGLAPIFPYTFYHLTHYWFAAADIPVANDTPVHYADAIRCNVRRPPQGSLPLLTRRVSA